MVRRHLRLAVVPFLGIAFASSACERRVAGRPTDAAPATAAPAQALLLFERRVAGNLDLYTVPASGGLERRLTDDPAEDSLPRWMPDGRSIVFSSNRSGNWQLWEMSAEGGPATRLRANEATEWQSDPSRDGRQIAFLSNVDGAEALWVMDRATGTARRLVEHNRHSILGNPSWGPGDDRIVFSSNWNVGHQIYLWSAAGGEPTRISPLVHGGCGPRFGPDRQKIVYVTRKHIRERSWIMEHDLVTNEERALVDWPALNYDPTYSPDGTEVAFASNITGDYEIYRVRVADGQSWRVTFGHGPARVPDYRPAPGAQGGPS
jgi:Tol biopolymer transport system component